MHRQPVIWGTFRWAAFILMRRKRERIASLTPDLFCRPENGGTMQSDCSRLKTEATWLSFLHNCYVTPLRLMLFMTSNYITHYQNKSGVRLATRPLFLRVRTGTLTGHDDVITMSIITLIRAKHNFWSLVNHSQV